MADMFEIRFNIIGETFGEIYWPYFYFSLISFFFGGGTKISILEIYMKCSCFDTTVHAWLISCMPVQYICVWFMKPGNNPESCNQPVLWYHLWLPWNPYTAEKYCQNLACSLMQQSSSYCSYCFADIVTPLFHRAVIWPLIIKLNMVKGIFQKQSFRFIKRLYNRRNLIMVSCSGGKTGHQ